MSTIIPIAQIEKGRKAADSCVHFGFCTAVCPTYVLDGEENDSPRGRIGLIKDMLNTGGKPGRAVVKHVDRCLSCLSCVTTCAAGVDYRTLVDTARDYIEASKVRSVKERIVRKGLAITLTTPWLLRILVGAARPFARMAGRLPGMPGALGRMAQAPGIRALAPRPSGNPSAESETGKLGRTVALLDGCAQSVLGREINDATQRVLARMGVRVIQPPRHLAQACCGAMNLHMGYRDKATQQAGVLVDYWASLLEQGKIDTIIVTTSGCGSVIQHYQELFPGDAVRAARAERVAQASMDISQFLAEYELPAAAAHKGARVAYHDSCSLKHGQKITRQPRKVLKRLGFTAMDIAESHLCCGSAGTYNLLQPQIADRLGQRKADNIAAVKPDVIAAGNLGCLLQISRFTPTPIAHVVQLADWATGGPPPRGLESFQPPVCASPSICEMPGSADTGAVPPPSDTNSLW